MLKTLCVHFLSDVLFQLMYIDHNYTSQSSFILLLFFVLFYFLCIKRVLQIKNIKTMFWLLSIIFFIKHTSMNLTEQKTFTLLIMKMCINDECTHLLLWCLSCNIKRFNQENGFIVCTTTQQKTSTTWMQQQKSSRNLNRFYVHCN